MEIYNYILMKKAQYQNIHTGKTYQDLPPEARYGSSDYKKVQKDLEIDPTVAKYIDYAKVPLGAVGDAYYAMSGLKDIDYITDNIKNPTFDKEDINYLGNRIIDLASSVKIPNKLLNISKNILTEGSLRNYLKERYKGKSNGNK